MKKLISTLLVLGFLVPVSLSIQSSWQVFDGYTNNLTVHETDSQYSAVCFKGKADMYDGHCTEGGEPTNQYMRRLKAE